MEPLLGVAIGLVLTFALVAVIVSSVTELFSGAVRVRARGLEAGIARMLDDATDDRKWWKRWTPFASQTPTPATTAVLNHPLIKSLSTPRASDRPSSYVNAVTFASAFLGSTLTSDALFAKFAADADALQQRIDALSAGEPGDTVKQAWQAAGKEPAKLITALLADREHGLEGLAGLMGSTSDVDARVQQLTAAGDPAAAPIAGAWAAATGTGDAKVADFIRRIDRPALVTSAVAGVDSVKAGLDELEAAFPPLGKSLDALWNKAGHDFDKFRHEIEDWFDREMARVSGWYSRWAQWLMLGIALVVAFGLNISAFTIGKDLWNDPTLREKATIEAKEQVQAGSTEPAGGGTKADAKASGSSSKDSSADPVGKAPAAADTLKAVGFPIGWNRTSWPGTDDWGYLLLHILGIIMVGVAASFGAPFWFDTLNKLVNLRMTGQPPPTAAAQRPVSPPAT